MATMLLAWIIGWYLVIVGVFMLTQSAYARTVIADVLAHRGLIFVLSLMTVIIGLVLVATHNIWVAGWPLIITLFSWLVLVSGLTRLFFTDFAIKMANSFINHPKHMLIAGIICLIIGIVLLACRYHAYMGLMMMG